jgi:hypothetical protein
MKRRVKQNIVLAAGAVVLSCLLGQTAQATLITSGISVLADTYGANTGPEAVTVNYSVNLNAGVYTYAYVVNNPAGDIQLPGSPHPGSPEIVDTFSVAFNTGLTGAYIPFSASGGLFSVVGGTGISWILIPVIPAGSSSGMLSFESLLPPVPGDATAQDSNPPSPWASFPDGQEVPVPGPTVPDSMNTMAMLASMLLFLPFASILKKKASLA